MLAGAQGPRKSGSKGKEVGEAQSPCGQSPGMDRKAGEETRQAGPEEIQAPA